VFRAGLSVGLALCLWSVVSGPASLEAFVRIGSRARWETLPVPYRIHAGGLPLLGNNSEFIAVQKAFQTWEDLTTCAVAFRYEGTTDVQTGGNDGVNVISFQSSQSEFFGSGTIAVTISTSSQGRFIDADILFNHSNPNITFATDGSSDDFDVQAIATHEIGHFVGLDHTSIVSATMNPTGARGSVFPRVLKSDDIIGASTIYPEPNFLSITGGLLGRVTNSGANVFGAHVVLVDGEGNAVVSTLTGLDGTYEISGLPPGTYSAYAEPLDGPVTEANVGGQFDSRVNVNFTTTFLGNTLNPNQRQTFQISAGSTLQEVNIAVLPSPASPLNLTSPSLGQRISQGTTIAFTARGEGVIDGISFQVLGTGINLASPVFMSGNSARLTTTVDAAAPVGLRTLFARRSDATSALSGGLIITGEPPTLSSVSPSSGGNSGGTRVTITGANFRAGMQVAVGGVPLTDVAILNPTTVAGTTGSNRPGNLTLLAVNPDGTSGTLLGGFAVSAPPPGVSSVSPLSGPPETVVTILGSNFDTNLSNVTVRFNGVPATIVSAAATQIVTIVPYGASTGPISVSIFDQSVTGPQFTVSAPQPSSNRAEPQFQYVDVSTGGTTVTFQGSDSADDGLAELTLPFDFSLFSTRFLAGAKFFVTTNGWMSFSSPGVTAEWQNGPLPGTSVPRQGSAIGTTGTLAPSLIAPFFDDLVLDRSDSKVMTRLLGTAPQRRWVIDWQNLNILDENGSGLGSRVSFQAILFEESNDIAFQYKTLEGPRSLGESATVGLQNAGRSLAAQFSFDQASLYSGRAVAFRFNPNDATYQIVASEIKQYIPFVIDTVRFRTNLGLTNLSAVAAQATVTLYDGSGGVIASRATSLPPSGLTQLNNVISFVRGTSPLETNNLSGSVIVTADQPLVTFATQIDNTTNDPSLLIGKAVGATQLLIQSTTSVSQFRSSLVVQNAGTAPAQVQLRQRDTDGVIRGELTISIPANSHFSSDDIHATLGVGGLFGPLEITSLNSVPVVATSRVYTTNSGTSGFFEGQEVSAASQNGVIPISRDTSAFRTNLGISNLGNVTANVQVSLSSVTGALLGTTAVTVPAGGLVQLNSVNRALTGAPGVSNTTGYLRITSDQPVLGFSSLIDNSSDDPGLALSSAAGATRLIIPSATNVNQFRSNVTIVNLSGNTAASVRITSRDTSGSVLAQSTIAIPPNGAYLEEDILSSLGLSNRFGPLEIQCLNNLPLSAVSRVYSIFDNTSGFFTAQPY
jgi:Matrixin/IPT/TIG domain